MTALSLIVSGRRLALALLIGFVALPSPVLSGQSWMPHRKPAPRASAPRSLAALRHPWPARRAAVPRAPAATVTEVEPNDSLTQANPVSLGDVASGVISTGPVTVDSAGDSLYVGDQDYYVLNIAAGTIVDLRVDANCCGSPLDPVLVLLDSAGGELAFNDDYDGLDSRIIYPIPVTGRYYVGIAGFAGIGCDSCTYSLTFGSIMQGPGDPTTLFATGLDGAWGVAAGPRGELYVGDGQTPGVLYRVSPSSEVSQMSIPGYAAGAVVDGFGDVLVAGMDAGLAQGFVWRVTPGGQVSVFRDGLPSAAAVTIGPDGDVWVLDPRTPALWRFDPVGTPKGMIDISGTGAGYFDVDLKFSPSGILHFTNSLDGVYAIVGGGWQKVITTPEYDEGLAFDRDGYLYVSNGYQGTVDLYDPNYQLVGGGAFAGTNLGGQTFLAFGRDSGGVTSRLFADNAGLNLQAPYVGSVVEMNPTGMRAPGFRVGVDLLALAPDTIRPGVVGAVYADTLRIVNPPSAVTWSVANGALPGGLTLESASGLVTGIPRDSGAFSFTVRGQAGAEFGIGTFTLRVSVPDVAVDDAATDLLGGTPLPDSLERFLDLQGNRNGRFDVGDFRAYLRARGRLPAAPARKEEL